MFFKVLGRATWLVLRLVAPALARKTQRRLTGKDPKAAK
jgi:hypothetical protein